MCMSMNEMKRGGYYFNSLSSRKTICSILYVRARTSLQAEGDAIFFILF